MPSSKKLIIMIMTLFCFIILFLVIHLTTLTFACSQPAPSGEYITDVTLLSSTDELLVENSGNDCFIWTVGTSNEQDVDCDTYYSSTAVQNWSKGDVDHTNTTINGITIDNDIYSTVEMIRDGSTMYIDISNFSINSTILQDWAYWTITTYNTTFLSFAINYAWINANDSIITLAIEFESQASNAGTFLLCVNYLVRFCICLTFFCKFSATWGLTSQYRLCFKCL